jgi:hypothetical protein
MTDAEAQRLVLQRLYEIRHSNPNATPKVFQDLQLGDADLFGIMDQLAQLSLISWRPHRSARTGKIDDFANATITAVGVRSLEQSIRDKAAQPSTGPQNTIDINAAQKQFLDILRERLARVEKGEVWGSDHPGPYSAEEKSKEIDRIKARIASLEDENLAVETHVLHANDLIVGDKGQSSFEFNLSNRPTDIRDAARILVTAITDQISKLQALKPNAEDELAKHNEYVNFLEKLARGLNELADALDRLVLANAKGLKEPLLLGEAGKIARQLGTDVREWIELHHADIVDFTMKIGFVAAAYNFMHACGVEGLTASIISGFLTTSLSKKNNR